MEDCIINIKQEPIRTDLSIPLGHNRLNNSSKEAFKNSKRKDTSVNLPKGDCNSFKTPKTLTLRTVAQKPIEPSAVDDGKQPLSFPSHMKCDSTKQDDVRECNNVKNPLQYKYSRANAATTDTITKVMSSKVSFNIEPVFSRKSSSKFCAEAGIHPHLSACLSDRFKVDRLTAIQAATIPALLRGDDGLVRAQTGSGKTLAYAIPLLNQLINMEPPVCRSDGPLALVILPTRELASQTFDVFHNLVHSCVRIVPALLIGGTKRKAQKASLRKGVNIVIGTSQRLIDHMIRTSSLHLNRLKWLIIDEADRLLEMGFEHSVRQILGHINQVRKNDGENRNKIGRLQTVLISATLTEGVENLAGMALRSPVRCTVGETGRSSGKRAGHLDTDSSQQLDQFSMPSGLRHFVLAVPWKLRLVSLAAFLLLKCRYHRNGGKLIIFMATQDSVDFHYQLFKTVLCPDDEELLNIVSSDVSNLLLFRLHGSMQHSERQSVFRKFAGSVSGVLMTTDVASRGIDLAGVAWVVLYHLTGSPVDYVHRVGRTARAGGKGKALIFLDPSELGFADYLTSRFGVHFEQQLSLSELLQTVLFHLQHTRQPGQRRAQSTTVEESASRFSYLFMDAVSEDCVLNPLAESAYISFIRAYASFSGELRAFFPFKRLHLGHVANAFCLKVTPTEVARRVTGKRRREDSGARQSGSKKPFDRDVDEHGLVDDLVKYASLLVSFYIASGRNGKSVTPLCLLPFACRRDFHADKSERLLRNGRQHSKLAGKDKARQNMLAEYGL